MEPFVESITSSRFESLNPSFDLCKDFSQKKPGNSDFNSKNSKSVEFEGYQEAVETAGSPRSGSVKWGIHENPETVRSKADWDVENIFSEIKRTCVDCQTSKTPLWRSGPAGPKSLCNACGIRYRKKRRAAIGLNTEKEKERKKNAGVSLKLRLLALGGDFFVQKKRKLAKEEEEAAVLLMALSGGFLHA